MPLSLLLPVAPNDVCPEFQANNASRQIHLPSRAVIKHSARLFVYAIYCGLGQRVLAVTRCLKFMGYRLHKDRRARQVDVMTVKRLADHVDQRQFVLRQQVLTHHGGNRVPQRRVVLSDDLAEQKHRIEFEKFCSDKRFVRRQASAAQPKLFGPMFGWLMIRGSLHESHGKLNPRTARDRLRTDSLGPCRE